MVHIHDNKPAISSGQASLFVDIIFWHPNEKNALALTRILESHHLGERSQTIEWLNKITVRLSMWQRQYLAHLEADLWPQVNTDLKAFIRETAQHYAVKKVEYDTRAFSVGLAKKVRKQTHRLEDLDTILPDREHPVWWIIHP